VASAVAEISPQIASFCLSLIVVGGSGTVGLKKQVIEVEGISKEEATYPSPVLSKALLD